MPDDGLETLKPFDAIYFGAVGAPDVPDHYLVSRLPICQGFDQEQGAAAKILPGISSPLRDVGVGDLTGSLFAKIQKGISVMAGVPIKACQKRSEPRWLFLPAPA